MVLWYDIQPPPFFPTVGCEALYSHIASYNEILKEPALISNTMYVKSLQLTVAFFFVCFRYRRHPNIWLNLESTVFCDLPTVQKKFFLMESNYESPCLRRSCSVLIQGHTNTILILLWTCVFVSSGKQLRAKKSKEQHWTEISGTHVVNFIGCTTQFIVSCQSVPRHV